MLLHNLKQIFRGLWRYKGFTFINLLGLSIGIAATLIIFLISDFENSFDDFHSGKNEIYRVVKRTTQDNKEEYSARVPYPTAKSLREEYAGLVATQLHFLRDMNVRIGKQDPFTETNILFADSMYFKVFDFSGIHDQWIIGNPATSLTAPNKVVLTESAAKKYFGGDNPIGQLIRLNNIADVEVNAIIKDLPANTHMPLSMIVSYPTLNKEFLGGLDPNSWSFTSSGFAYVRLKDPSSVNAVENALQSAVKKNASSERYKRGHWYLQSLANIHFDPTFEDTNPSYTVSRKYLTMLLLLAGFIVLIACVNYINLSTSLAFTKSKEVGIRKTIGASKLQLLFHYMLETVLVTTVATLIGLILAAAMLPTINNILDKSVSLQQLLTVKFIAGIISGILLISFISGIYPALILSGFSPIAALKNRFILPGRSSAIFRKALVVFQFSISIALIICTIVIARQMQYFQSKELGFNKEAVIELSLPNPDSTRMESLRSFVQNQPGVQNLSFCLGAPISENGFNTSFGAPGLSKDMDYNLRLIPCDKAYLDVYGLKLLAGRWFLPGEEKNLGSGLVINEALMKTLGYKNPADAVGKQISIGVNDYSPTIIGVTQNFHISSLHENISPVGLMPFPYFYYAAAIRIQPGSIQTTLAGIGSAWKKVYPESPYEYTFVDETLAESYDREAKDFDLFKAFSLISIFICCIGLWGLIAFVVVRKTKEIGIRKVLGATVSGIVSLLSKDFLKLIFLALAVASPIAWYFMNDWLKDFAYRINISWWMFAIAGAFAVIIALLTISFQTIRAAVANPVKNLRTE
jgi:putative ABC transport system permease protein